MTEHNPHHIKELLGITDVYFNGRRLKPEEYEIIGRRSILLNFEPPTVPILYDKPPWWAFWRKPTPRPGPVPSNVVTFRLKDQDREHFMFNVMYREQNEV